MPEPGGLGALWRWTPQDGGEPLWLVDWAVPDAPGRRVVVVADTTDSCWPQRRDALQRVLRAIGAVLRRGDRIELWMLGHVTPTLRYEVVSDAAADLAAVASALGGALAPVETGTWLAPTVRALVGDGARTPGVLVVVTDGEVFDADDVPAPPPELAPAVVYLDVVPQPPPFWPSGAHVTAGAPAFERVLPDVPARAALVGVGERAAYLYDGSGDLSARTPADLARKSWAPGERVRVVLTGATPPAPRLRLHHGGGVCEYTGQRVAPLVDGPHMAALVRAALRVDGLRVRWNELLVRSLADGNGGEVACPACRRPHRLTAIRGTGRALCAGCSAVLLLHGKAQLGDPALAAPLSVLLGVPASGPVEPLPDPLPAGARAYDVVTTGAGERGLVVCIGASSVADDPVF